jgi:hypothetical protein
MDGKATGAMGISSGGMAPFFATCVDGESTAYLLV